MLVNPVHHKSDRERDIKPYVKRKMYGVAVDYKK